MLLCVCCPSIYEVRRIATKHIFYLPASMAQSDARPTGDQEVAVLGSCRLITKYFLQSLSSFR